MIKTALLLFCLMLMQASLHIKTADARSEDVLHALSGRYSWHFKNGNVQGDVYWSDDVVEIVPVGDNGAYIRIDLEFFNDHKCLIDGVGKVDGKQILYTDNDRTRLLLNDKPCILSLLRQGNNLLIDDGNGGCKMHCGMRGSFIKQTVPFASRRPISYMKILMASKQYKNALDVWDSRQNDEGSSTHQ